MAPDLRDLRHIGGAALAAFDFYGAYAHCHELRQQLQCVQAGGLFNGVVAILPAHLAHVKTAFAQGGVARVFAFAVAVNEHAIQARLKPLGGLQPAHGFGG